MPHTDPLEQSFDRFTLPTDIPDAAYWTKDGTFEEAVRRRAAARAGDNPPSGHPELVEGRLSYGVSTVVTALRQAQGELTLGRHSNTHSC